MSNKAGTELVQPGARFLTPEMKALVGAVTTTRVGGESLGCYAEFNVGDHVGDNPRHVAANRLALAGQLGLRKLHWVKQVHGTKASYVSGKANNFGIEADALWTDRPKVGLCIMTADCLPIFITDSRAQVVALVHGGWRSLAGGIIQKLSTHFAGRALALRAWIGPGISFASYPVGSQLYDEIYAAYGEKLASQVCREHKGALHADLALLARYCLSEAAIEYCGVSSACNYLDSRFYSHRRASVNATSTGRMASVIWIR